MSRRWLLSLLCISAGLVLAQLSAARSGLLVNESATQFLIHDQPLVLLEVNNPAAQSVPARLKLDLLDPKEVARAMAVRDVVLRPGVNKLSIALRPTALDFSADADKILAWYRLRYQIDPEPSPASLADAARGVISLSEIKTPNIFSLEVSTASPAHRGTRHYTHIRTLHPITAKPVKDVNVNVEFMLFEGEKTLRGSASTNADGYALIGLDIPARMSGDDGELKVVARHGGYVKKTSNDIEFDDSAQIMITTDKPIYQPGQPLHVRALMFDSSKRAAANAQATLTIVDPEGINVFKTTLRASRFGVASADWAIPETVRLGDYMIRVEMDDENYSDSAEYRHVKISRYDLPNFAVSVKPDRSFYLPQQNASVEVRADYLFGQPVKRGRVRVVREEDREWNFREQQWDVENGESYEGDTDESGRFVAQVDLTKAHAKLAEEEYSRFTDLNFAAYFSDPSTNRTEQRRFSLRVTRSAIHVYVSSGRNRQSRDLPLQFYLSTSYADGRPAACNVEIRESANAESGAPRRLLQTIRTNKFGIAKVTGLNPPGAEENVNPSLDFKARDGAFTGQHTESFYYWNVPVVRVETDKSIYRPGEAIEVTISASKPEMNMILEVSRGLHTIESRSLTLHNGAAKITLRHRPAFKDEINLAAYLIAPEYQSSYALPFDSRTVLFPRDRDLKLNLKLDRADYKPGEEATVDFRISNPDGRPADSALGIVVFDRAVEERARTDQEFSGQFGFYGSFNQWRGYADEVAGITRKDLQQIDLSKPLSQEMELVAELLLGAGSARPKYFHAEDFDKDHRKVFAELTTSQFEGVGEILETNYKNGALYPTSGEALRRLLFESGVNIDRLRDPWGTRYREVFSIVQNDSVLEIVSAGPDKTFDTKDDFPVKRIARPYFRFTGEAINRAVHRFHARTGGFIRDAATLKKELLTEGINFDSLLDPWGQNYKLSFTTRRNNFNVIVRSAGPDKRFADVDPESDDLTLWTTSIDYMIETRARIEDALADYAQANNVFPRDDDQLGRAFAVAAIEPERLRDPWGRPYYAVYKTESRNGDRAQMHSFTIYGHGASERTELVPVTQEVSSIALYSSGEDGKKGTIDDFDAALFSQVTGQVLGPGDKPTFSLRPVSFSGGKGAIKGTVTDPTGAAIAGAMVKATLKNSSHEFETTTNDDGKFILRNLPVGLYELRCDSSGFKWAVVTEVPVSSSNITTLDFMLSPGAITETVTVTAEAATVDQLGSVSRLSSQNVSVSIRQSNQLATPRLREYFPETLVWQPLLETDKQGRAQVKFKLADNITTWKMSVLSSTEDGELGTAETEIKAFQPFFVEHDPPRVLTEGDRISLPVVLRNYLERAQTVDLEIKPESWFALQGPARQRAEVPAGDASRQTFELMAVASIEDGKQRITARGFEASDAIEKPVTVHPDGEPKTQTASELTGDSAVMDLKLPAHVIPGSIKAELKIYPSLLDHVVESIEGILERPHGCGEQTISSTYPSLLVLRGHKYARVDSRTVQTARRYVQLGYQRLLNYRTSDGGFSYWGRDDADLALTAYALRFLHDAKEFVPIEDEVVEGARQWLFKRQHADGSWPGSDNYSQGEIQSRTALLTAFVARVLAMTESRGSNVSAPLQRALAYLAPKVEAINEPYLIASYALAALDASDTKAASRAAAKLRTLAHKENDMTYWSLDTSTPFYGWGIAGRVETTALVVQALRRIEETQATQSPAGEPATDSLVRSGVLFLLKEKDRYGVWHSTQATINVLDTIMTLLGSSSGPQGSLGNAIEVIVDGQFATSLRLPSEDQESSLIRADISRFLHGGSNRVELRQGSRLVSVHLVANYYVPWANSDATQNPETKTGAPKALRLTAAFNKLTAKVNEEIACNVKVERTGSHGFGMMLAEIGLPPGAEVDRASLESAMKNSSWAISQYDILPDRVIVYLWPRAGGVAFSFKFRPRFAMSAKTAPSIVYDYYNPEARAIVAPATFFVR